MCGIFIVINKKSKPVNLPKCRKNSKKSDRIILVEKMVTDTPSNTLFHRITGGLSSMHPSITGRILIASPTLATWNQIKKPSFLIRLI